MPSWLDRDIYPFEQRFLELPSGRMHYVDEGSGQPVVMLHGNPTWSFLYRHLISYLSDSYRCIAPDHLGFGLSDKPFDWEYRPEDHAANFSTLVEQLQLEHITLVVQDWGGPIGLSWAVEYPERIRRIVILNTWAWPVHRDPYYWFYSRFMGGAIGRFLIRRYNLFARWMMPRMFGDRSKLSAHVHRHYLAPLQESHPQACWTFAREVTGSTGWLEQLHDGLDRLREKKILIVWGMKDIAFRRQELNRWIELFPRAEFERIDESGHFVQEEAPDHLNETVEKFLAR